MTAEDRCSFCGRPDGDVGRLFAGSRAFICDRCVERCAENFSGGSHWDNAMRTWVEHAPLSSWPRQRQSHFGDDVTCSFCGKAEPDLQWLIGCREPNTFVCDECVGVFWATVRYPIEPTSNDRVSRRAGRLHWPWRAPHLDKATSV